MYRKKLLEFADWLEKRKGRRFCMSSCECCISAWALKWAYGPKCKDIGTRIDLMHIFDLGDEAAGNLYVANGSKKDWSKIKRSEAVQALRNLANRRKIIWDC